MSLAVRRRDCKKGWRHFDAERLVCGQSHYSGLRRAIWVLEQRRSNGIPSRLSSLESVVTSIAESHACSCSVFTDCGAPLRPAWGFHHCSVTSCLTTLIENWSAEDIALFDTRTTATSTFAANARVNG